MVGNSGNLKEKSWLKKVFLKETEAVVVVRPTKAVEVAHHRRARDGGNNG